MAGAVGEDPTNIAEPIRHLAVPIGSVHPYPGNPRTHDLPAIAASLANPKRGQYKPITVNRRTGDVLAGNGTWEAARDILGWTQIAVTWVDVDDATAAGIVAVDNRTSDLAGYDDRLLADLLGQVDDLASVGYTAGDLDALLRELDGDGEPGEGNSDPDDVPEPPAGEPVTKPGDLWLLGPRHRLLCCDATDPASLDRLTDGAGEPGIVYTDPPYGIAIVSGGKGDTGGRGTIRNPTGYSFRGKSGTGAEIPATKYLPVAGDESTDTATDTFRLLSVAYPKALHVWWGGNHYAASAGLPDASCWLVWDKETTGEFADCELAWTNHPGPVRLLRHMWNGMLRASERGRRVHPTQKPVALAEWAFGVVDPKAERTVVLDVFAGSGSTLIAAERTNRTALVMELEPAYCDVILARFATHTGITPVHAETGEKVDFTGVSVTQNHSNEVA